MNKLEECVKDINNNHYEYLMRLQNVNGVAYGYKYVNNNNTLEPCINVLVRNKIDKKYLTKNNIVPKAYMGINTDVIECGEFMANGTNDLNYEIGLDKKIRPLTGGCAICIPGKKGEEEIAGSMCCIVKKKDYSKNLNKYYLLGANHVLSINGKKPIGSLVMQPVKLDETMPSKVAAVVAITDGFIPIKNFNDKNMTIPKNKVDCCIAKLINNSLISPYIFAYYTDTQGKDSYDIVELKDVTSAFLGMYVKQYGASSGRTYGQVKMTHGTFNIYVDNKKAMFIDQIVIDVQSKLGDSGAPVLSRKSNKLVAMHVGLNGNGLSVCNDINIIFKVLNIELYVKE